VLKDEQLEIKIIICSESFTKTSKCK